jgi:outer membrane lipoprotein SlyB
MLKKLLPVLTVAVILAACGPAPQPPVDPNAPQGSAASQPPTPPPSQAQTPAEPTAAEREAAARQAQAREARRAEQQAEQQQQARREACPNCGVIAAVNDERVQGDAGYVGTLGGAGAGALAGSQFGKKSGKFAMMALGAVGGALAGREVEKQVTATHVYHVTVNMESGGQRIVTVKDLNGMGVGTRVRVEGDSLQFNNG